MAVITKSVQAPYIVSEILLDLSSMVKPGISTMALENRAESLLKKFRARSYNRGYCPTWAIKPFPSILSVGIDNVIVHGFPTTAPLVEGQILSIDLGLVDSFGNCGDAAITVPVGEITNAKKRLLYFAYQTLMQGVAALKPGANTQTIARIINQYALTRGYKVNRKFGGHGIGKEMHERPHIYNTEEPTHDYAVIENGRIYCVEPIITNGNDSFGVADTNGWTYRTGDGLPSAFYEVMVKVTDEGPQILTHHIKEIPSL